MNDRYAGIIFIVLGIFFIVSRKRGARGTVKFYSKLGLHAKEQWYEISSLIAGIIFIIAGILMLMGIW